MSPQEYGALTGQHQQARQQAELCVCGCKYPDHWKEVQHFGLYCDCDVCEAGGPDALKTGPTRIDARLGCDHPPCEDWLRDVVEMAFVHADRIEIETWSFPEEEAPLMYDATYYREMAADAASDADRD